MLVKVGSLYLTLGTFVFRKGEMRIWLNSGSFLNLELIEAEELERILDEAIAAQKTVEQIVTEQRAQSEELQKRAEALQQREQYVEGIALQAHQIVNSQQQQQKSPVILPPGFGMKRK